MKDSHIRRSKEEKNTQRQKKEWGKAAKKKEIMFEK